MLRRSRIFPLLLCLVLVASAALAQSVVGVLGIADEVRPLEQGLER